MNTTSHQAAIYKAPPLTPEATVGQPPQTLANVAATAGLIP
jgi:hypothetical protein